MSSHGTLRLNCLCDKVTRPSPGDIEANNHRHLARNVRRMVYRANVRLGKALAQHDLRKMAARGIEQTTIVTPLGRTVQPAPTCAKGPRRINVRLGPRVTPA